MRNKNKILFGFGTNDADYNVYEYEVVDGKQRVLWICPFYVTWKHMLERSYSSNYQQKRPSYIGCTVTTVWHLFSNFKAWMEVQDWKGKELDKDILCPGNKVYGPDVCVFVDSRVNNFLIDCEASRGEFPIGVSFHKRAGKYIARCNSVVTLKNNHLGYHNTPEEAHLAWLSFKLEQAYILASEQTDERVGKALIERYENYVIL